jgi:hypothetical protein
LETTVPTFAENLRVYFMIIGIFFGICGLACWLSGHQPF